MFAIIATGGKQIFCEVGKEYFIEKIAISEKETIIFDQVLMIDDQVGEPFLKNAQVHAEIIKHDKAKKIVVFKYKPKKNSKTKYGHRQPYTKIKITAILPDATQVKPAEIKSVIEPTIATLENSKQDQTVESKSAKLVDKKVTKKSQDNTDKVKSVKSVVKKSTKAGESKIKSTANVSKKTTEQSKVEVAPDKIAIYDHKNLTVKFVDKEPETKVSVKKKLEK